MTKHEKPSAFLLYLVLIAVAYGPVLFSARSLAPPLLQPHGVVASWPRGYEGRTPANMFNMDIATPSYYEWPVNKFVGNSYKNKEMPLWNPNQAAGTPLIAQYSTRALFPYQILEDISPVKYWDFFLLGRLLIAGLFSFIFLRHLGLTFAPSFLSGALYMFSGSSIWFINLEQFANCAMMLPVLMWAIERLATKRSSWEVSISAVALALTALAGHPKMALYIVSIATLYFILRTLMLYKKAHTLRNIKRFALASLLSLLLAAPLLLPFAELMQNSSFTYSPGEVTRVPNIVTSGMAASIITPTAHESPRNRSFTPSVLLEQGTTPEGEVFFFRDLPSNGVWDLLGGYTGSITLLLVFTGLLSLPFGRKDPNTAPLLFFTGLSTLVLLINFGLEPFAQLRHLPLFDLFWSPKWTGPVWTFSFAVAAGLAFDTIHRAFDPKRKEALAEGESTENLYDTETEEPKKWSLGPPVILVPIIALALSLALLIYFVPVQSIMLFTRSIRTDQFLAALGPTLILGTLLSILFLIAAAFCVISYIRKGRALETLIPLALIELWWAIPRGYDTGWLYLKCVPLVLGLYITVQFFKGRRKSAALTVLLLFAAVMIIDYNSPKGLPDRYDPFTSAPYVEYLKEHATEGRVIAGHGILYPNFASALGIRDFRYINSLAIDTFQEYRDSHLQTLYPEGSSPPESSSLWFTGRSENRVDSENRKAQQRRGIEEDITESLTHYSLLSVKYIVLPARVDINEITRQTGQINETPVEFPRVYSDREVSIYENPKALPRAYVAKEIELAKGYKEAQERAGQVQVATGTAAVIEQEPPVSFHPEASSHNPEAADSTVTAKPAHSPEAPHSQSTQNNAGGAGGVGISGSSDIIGSTVETDTAVSQVMPNTSPEASKSMPGSMNDKLKQKNPMSAKILSERNNSVRVEATGPGLLVLTDTFYPGWSAKIGSEKAEIYRVNGIVRGVFISTGTHIIDFKYRPLSFIAGIILSSIALISCFWYGLKCERGRKKGDVTDEDRDV